MTHTRIFYLSCLNSGSENINMSSESDDVDNDIELMYLYLTLRKQKTRKRRIWVREIFQQRKICGTYHTLVQEMRLHDRESHFR